MAAPRQAVCKLMVLTLIKFVITSDVPYQEEWFDQTLDHFNFNRNPASGPVNAFTQRYLVQDKWWKQGEGPIFFYTGNEGPITTFWANTGFMFDIAPKFNALIIFAEHRYYGNSAPFGEWGPKASFQHPYIDLLTIEQAMADYAVMIPQLKVKYNATKCPVIAFGGSYGGMLSAYMRFKYPNIIDGAIAGSAPIYLVAGKTDPYAFFKTVTEDFQMANPQSVTRVREAYTQIAKLTQAGQQGWDEITKTFQLCSPYKASDMDHLILYTRNAFTSLAMMDYPYPTDFLAPLPAWPVKKAASLIMEGSTIEGLAKAVGLFYTYSNKTAMCYDMYKLFVECADPTGCGLGPDSLAWDYQACTEVQLVQRTNFKTDMFPESNYTYDARKKYCDDRWNVEPRDEWLGIQLWGKDIKHSSNIVFSNGNLDPWHLGGVLSNVSTSVVAVTIQDGAHHLDLRGSNPLDPESVIQAREKEKMHILKWVEEARRNM